MISSYADKTDLDIFLTDLKIFNQSAFTVH